MLGSTGKFNVKKKKSRVAETKLLHSNIALSNNFITFFPLNDFDANIIIFGARN